MPGGPISVSYSYDDCGQCVSEGVERKYEWDHAGRLRSFRNQATDATEPTQYVQYLYDASGQRVKKLNRKQLGSDWDVVVYIDGVLEQRTQQRGATTKQGAVLHVLDGGKRLGMRRTGETFDAKPEHLLLLSDHLGSGSVELDWSLGDFLDREEFRPYGETSFGSYAHKRYRFTGKERDEESGLNYHGARYYAPGLARWMSPDPKGLVDGVNVYGYVRGNPVRLSDPTGTEAEPSGESKDKAGSSPVGTQETSGVIKSSFQSANQDTPAQSRIRTQLASEMGNSFTISRKNENFRYPGFGERVSLESKYWISIMSKGEYPIPIGFRLKDGVSATVAVESAFNGETLVECQIALQLAFARGILRTIGSEAFDRAFGSSNDKNADLAVGFGDQSPQSKLRTLYEVRSLQSRSDLLPGDFVYFRNAPDYLAQRRPGSWRGENTVFLGNDTFSGHGVERLSEMNVNNRLFREYRNARGFGPSTPERTRDEWNAMKPVGLDLRILRPRIEQIQILGTTTRR